ncbi:hypothetical protein BaRGS_00037610, partial [Batillaria attramentaria]
DKEMETVGRCLKSLRTFTLLRMLMLILPFCKLFVYVKIEIVHYENIEIGCVPSKLGSGDDAITQILTCGRDIRFQPLLPRPNICNVTEAPTQPHPKPLHQLHYRPAPLGVEVRSVDLKDPDLPDSLVQQVRRDVHRHRLLIFKDQGVINGTRHVEIARWFGELKSDWKNHPRSPHKHIIRLSNDKREGLGGVGATGWHIDGSFYEKPYSVALYHIIAVPERGDTAFVPFKELVESLSPETRARWDRLWRVDHRWEGRNPLLYSHPVTGHPNHFFYSHPVTGHPALCFHNGGTNAFVWDYGTDQERQTDARETQLLLREIHHEITKDNNRLVYSHKWKAGDFIIADNLALGHYATPESQLPVSKIGLRILHRAVVEGKWPPRKKVQTGDN